MRAANYQPGRQYTVFEIDRLRDAARMLMSKDATPFEIDRRVRTFMIAGCDPEKVWEEGRRKTQWCRDAHQAYVDAFVSQTELIHQVTQQTAVTKSVIDAITEDLYRYEHPVWAFFLNIRDEVCWAWDNFCDGCDAVRIKLRVWWATR